MTQTLLLSRAGGAVQEHPSQIQEDSVISKLYVNNLIVSTKTNLY